MRLLLQALGSKRSIIITNAEPNVKHYFQYFLRFHIFTKQRAVKCRFCHNFAPFDEGFSKKILRALDFIAQQWYNPIRKRSHS